MSSGILHVEMYTNPFVPFPPLNHVDSLVDLLDLLDLLGLLGLLDLADFQCSGKSSSWTCRVGSYWTT